MTGSPSSPGRAPTTPPPRSGPPGAPPSSVPMRPWWSRRTTTARTAGCWRRISGRSRTRATCRSSSTTSRRGRAPTSMPARSCALPNTRESSRSRRPVATSTRSPRSAATGRGTWPCSPGTTPGPCRSSRWAVTVSCPWRPTRSRASSSRCARRRGPATGTLARRIHDRWLPLFQGNFRGGPNPVPVKAALSLMGLLESDAVRGPLLPLDPDGRAAMAVTLRGLGLLETGGGRIGARTGSREAVA